MTSAGSSRERSEPELSPDFLARLERNMQSADTRRARFGTVRRWRWPASVAIALAAAICWAAMPWTFGIGARALIGFATYVTFVLDIANRGDQTFLSFLGADTVPVFVDVLLLVGVASWLSWASRPEKLDVVGSTSPTKWERPQF